MSKLRGSFALCATICAVLVLALVASVVSYGSVRIGPWPFPPDDNDGGNIASGVHIGPWPFPPDDNVAGLWMLGFYVTLGYILGHGITFGSVFGGIVKSLLWPGYWLYAVT